MLFVTYESRNNPHVTIHVDGCNQIAKHGGEHQYDQGSYRTHAAYNDAERYAINTGLPVGECSFCRPKSHAPAELVGYARRTTNPVHQCTLR